MTPEERTKRLQQQMGLVIEMAIKETGIRPEEIFWGLRRLEFQLLHRSEHKEKTDE